MTENDTPSSETSEEPQSGATEVEETSASAPEVAEGADKPIAFEIKEVKDEAGSVKRHVVDLDRAVYDEKIDEIFAELRKTVVVDGFRRGKAPVSLLKNRFGKDAQKDALNDLAARVADQIIQEQDLAVYGEPSLYESQMDDESKPIRLEIDIEVDPKLKVQEYKGNTFEVEVTPVTDTMLENGIERIRNNNVSYVDIDDQTKPYEKGDAVVVDMHVTDESGKPMESLCREDFLLRDPERNLMPEVAEEMIGKKPGETFSRTVERTTRNRRGKDVTHKDNFTITIKKIQKAVVPELTDEFVKDLGGDLETVEDLRKDMRKDLEEAVESNKRERAIEKIFDHLIEKNPFDAPRTLLTHQEYRTIVEDSRRMEMMGLSLERIGMTTDTYLEHTRGNAERLVKMNMLIQALADSENIEVTDEDLEKEIERMAEEQGRRPLAVRARLEREKRLDDVKETLRVNKVEDFLIANNEIREVEPKPQAEEPATEEPVAEEAVAEEAAADEPSAEEESPKE